MQATVMVVLRTNQQYQNQEIRRQACCGTRQKHKTSVIHLSSHYYTTDLSSIAQNAFSLGDFGDRD
jgi:hypothetical protein